MLKRIEEFFQGLKHDLIHILGPKKSIEQSIRELAQDAEKNVFKTTPQKDQKLLIEKLKLVWDKENDFMSSFISITKERVVLGQTNPVVVDVAGIDKVLSVHFSASGCGKYRIIKDDEVVATLFTHKHNYQAEYLIPFDVEPSTKLVVDFISKDIHRFDMYASIQVQRSKVKSKRNKKDKA